MGMTNTIAPPWCNAVIQRRFPVAYLTVRVMRRPRVVSEQHEVCAFLCLYVSRSMSFEKTHRIGNRCPSAAVCSYSNSDDCPHLPNGCLLSEQSKRI